MHTHSKVLSHAPQLWGASTTTTQTYAVKRVRFIVNPHLSIGGGGGMARIALVGDGASPYPLVQEYWCALHLHDSASSDSLKPQ